MKITAAEAIVKSGNETAQAVEVSGNAVVMKILALEESEGGARKRPLESNGMFLHLQHHPCIPFTLHQSWP